MRVNPKTKSSGPSALPLLSKHPTGTCCGLAFEGLGGVNSRCPAHAKLQRMTRPYGDDPATGGCDAMMLGGMITVMLGPGTRKGVKSCPAMSESAPPPALAPASAAGPPAPPASALDNAPNCSKHA